MRRGALWAALALALPVIGMLASVAANEAGRANATEWRIPITGYDPRDPLRGRYIAFRYAWRFAGGERSCTDATCRLCLTAGGQAVTIVRRGAVCPAAVDPAASGLSVSVGEDGQVTAGTRLWVSEASAPALDAQLRARPMVAVARLTRAGRLTPIRLEPARRGEEPPAPPPGP